MANTVSRPVSAGLRTGLHLLVVALSVFVILRAAFGVGRAPVPVLILGILFLGLYLAGIWWGRPEGYSVAVAAWLGTLTALWATLIWLSPDAAYLVFPLFFLYLALLPRTGALSAVAVSAVVSILAIAVHGSFSIAGVVGPLIGAGIAVAIGLGYQGLVREGENRERLIGELMAARERLATTEREAGKLAERERLARDIHDTVAQGLSSIQLLLHAAEREGSAQPERAMTHVRRAREAAALALAETRGLIDELAPPAMTGASLSEALTRLADTTAAQSGIAVNLHESGEPSDLSTVVKTGLLRIAQGALANVVRHARAGRADVTLTYLNDEVILDVVDDGVGFDPDALAERAAGGSFGLIAMRQRIAELGGTLTVESAPGEGTSVTARFGESE